LTASSPVRAEATEHPGWRPALLCHQREQPVRGRLRGARPRTMTAA